MTLGRRIGVWLAWWIGLFWFWLLLVGEWDRIELVAAACAAIVCTGLAEFARTSAGLRFRVPLAWIVRAKGVPLAIVVDFGIVMWVLVRAILRRERPHGLFRVKEFTVTEDDPTAFGTRAWVTLSANYSPNAYVIDIDCDRRLVLLHDLVPRESSEEPA